MGTVALGAVMLVMVAIAGYLIGTMIRSIQNERRSSNVRKIWRNFGLSLAFAILFVVSWIAQAVAQWQQYVDQQRDHDAEVNVVDYLQHFSQSTLENWQSEFLQLFSFTVLAAVLIHRGSAESKDSDEQMQAALQRIEEKLGTRG